MSFKKSGYYLGYLTKNERGPHMKISNAFTTVNSFLHKVLQFIFSLIFTSNVVFKFSFICCFTEVLLHQKPSENKQPHFYFGFKKSGLPFRNDKRDKR
jgi:hypothetical protein